MPTSVEVFSAAVRHYQQGDLQQAANECRAVLEADPRHLDALRLLGAICHRSGDYDIAIDCLSRAVALRPDVAGLHNHLAAVQLVAGRLDEATASCRRAMAIDPNYAEAHLNLGNVLHTQGRLAEATDCYRAVLRLAPENVDAHNNLGLALKGLGRLDEAIDCYTTAVRIRPDYAGAYVNLGNALNALARIDEAIAACQQAVRLVPNYATAHANLGNFYHSQGKLDLAAAAFEEALRLTGSATIRYTLATMVPVVYQSAAEIEGCRQRLVQNLAKLVEEGVQLDPIREKLPTHFFLAYQGRNDRPVMETIAWLCAGSTRDLTQKPAGGPRAGGRIRVGFISSFFKDHTIGQLNRGLIEKLSRERFEVTVLSLAAADDPVAGRIRESADRAIELPPDLARARQSIADEQLDLLFYTDIGMDPAAYALAVSRLAPVQCVTWGHPVTTGLPTIDYFLSSEFIEPPNADEHYSERLVKLSRLTTYYYRPELPVQRKTRGDFGLPADRRLYLCPQTLFKFHPDFDEALAEILRRDRLGLVVLLKGRYPTWTELLRERLARSMADVVDRIRFVPSQSRPDFLNLIAACDVMLDTFHFGGGNTTYEALALGTPVVTLPSALLRGRITYGCYQQMNVLDCVAADPSQYIEIAVRLGTDRNFRESVRQKILAAGDSLFEDDTAVRDIERFFEEAVAAANEKAH
jgi:protein O-GlcNAc transferase